MFWLAGAQHSLHSLDAEGHVITIQVYMDSLVLRSEYFKTMLSTNMREQQTKRIRHGYNFFLKPLALIQTWPVNRVVTSQPYAFLAMIDFFYYEGNHAAISHSLHGWLD